MRMMHGRTLLFVGDSTQTQFFVSLSCLVHSAGYTVKKEALIWWDAATALGQLNKKCVGSAADRCQYTSGCITFMGNVQLCVCQSYSPKGRAKGTAACLEKQQMTNADILVFGSTALWQTKLLRQKHDQAAAARTEVRELLSLVRSAPSATPKFSGTLIYREATAQHFNEPGGQYASKTRIGLLNGMGNKMRTCVPRPAPEMVSWNAWNMAAHELLLAANITILPVWETTSDASDAHVDAGDCTHFCSPGIGDDWSDMLLNALKSIMLAAPPGRRVKGPD
jgi:hypothetical protein